MTTLKTLAVLFSLSIASSAIADARFSTWIDLAFANGRALQEAAVMGGAEQPCAPLMVGQFEVTGIMDCAPSAALTGSRRPNGASNSAGQMGTSPATLPR